MNGSEKTAGKSDTVTVEHGVVILAVGAENRKTSEYLYGQDERIITQRELEEKITNNQLSTPNSQLSTIVMIQCVGSREKDSLYCRWCFY